MKINFIIPFITYTGGIKIILEYGNRLKNKGHDVMIYTPIIAYDFSKNSNILAKIKKIKNTAGNIKRGTNIKTFDLDVPIKLVLTIKDMYIRDADVTIATAWPTAYDVYNLSISKGKKFYFIQGYEIWSGILEKVNNSYRLPIKHITISKYLKNILHDKFQDTNVDIVYNGINFDEFYNNKKIVNENKVVCMMYSGLELKGFKDGIKVFEIVKKKIKELKLVLFGMERGDDIPSYAKFYLNPSKNQLREIYSNSDIFLFPSKADAWGLTPLEAMVCKCAVVGTNVGCLNEFGIHGENSMISEPNNIDKMVENLYKILNDDDLLYSISLAGYNMVQQFNWENSVEKFEMIIKH
jgi:glycosyltransferase involved in cell wall biosynthesis